MQPMHRMHYDAHMPDRMLCMSALVMVSLPVSDRVRKCQARDSPVPRGGSMSSRNAGAGGIRTPVHFRVGACLRVVLEGFDTYYSNGVSNFHSELRDKLDPRPTIRST